MWVFSISCWLVAVVLAFCWFMRDRKIQRERKASQQEWLRRIREMGD